MEVVKKMLLGIFGGIVAVFVCFWTVLLQMLKVFTNK